MSESTKQGLRVLVCGGRDYRNKEHAFAVLDALHTRGPIGLIIQGGATGADYIAHRWAEERGVPRREFPADWNTHGRAAGPIRNAQMIAEGRPDLIVAFKGGRGTKDLLSRARAAGIPVEVGGGNGN